MQLRRRKEMREIQGQRRVATQRPKSAEEPCVLRLGAGPCLVRITTSYRQQTLRAADRAEIVGSPCWPNLNTMTAGLNCSGPDLPRPNPKPSAPSTF